MQETCWMGVLPLCSEAVSVFYSPSQLGKEQKEDFDPTAKERKEGFTEALYPSPCVCSSAIFDHPFILSTKKKKKQYIFLYISVADFLCYATVFISNNHSALSCFQQVLDKDNFVI